MKLLGAEQHAKIMAQELKGAFISKSFQGISRMSPLKQALKEK